MKNFAVLLSFAIAATSSVYAIPTLTERQDNSSVTVDWSALSGAALENFTAPVVPLAITNQTIDYDFDSAAEDAIAASFEQTTQVTGISTDDSSDSSSGSNSRRSLVNKRANSNCGAPNPNPAASLTAPLNIKSFGDFQTNKALVGSAQNNFNVQSFKASGVQYSRAFKNLDAAYQGTSYLGSYSIPRYNTAYCGQLCNYKAGCQSFNTYFEYDPAYAVSDSCPTSDGIVNVNCVLWGEPASAAGATNTGTTTYGFTTAIRGSSAWVMSAREPKYFDDYTAPQTVPGNLDNRIATGDPELAPNWPGQIIIRSTGALPLGQPYDEALCKAVADADPQAVSFSTFQLLADEVYMGQGCLTYSESNFATSDFNDGGQYRPYSAAAQKAGKTGNAFWKSNPVVFYVKKSTSSQQAS